MKPVKITLIAALSKNRVIGINNTLPWKLPEDLKRFRALTRGHPVIMGRKTFESIGRPLPERLNLVISRHAVAADLQGRQPGVEWCQSLEAALERAQSEAQHKNLTQVFVIGGEQIYKLALPHADRLELTWVEATIQGDAFFPEFDPARFREVSREVHPASGDQPAYAFCTLERA